jgi:effector-binding domain-containing protein
VSTLHEGSWMEMPSTYQTLIADLFKFGHSMSGLTREVYLNMDFENPENNNTEIQIGIN